MWKSVKYLGLLLFITSILTGCKLIVLKSYGFKLALDYNEDTQRKFEKKYKIPENSSFQLDTSFHSYIMDWDTTLYKREIKDHLQPLQALYYDKQGNLISFHINCYAGGFPNLKWNRGGIMEVFPPLEQAPLDTLLPLNKHLTFLNPSSTLTDYQNTTKEYTTIVYWSAYFGRQSKRLIKQVKKNNQLSNNQEIDILYINIDDFWMHLVSE